MHVRSVGDQLPHRVGDDAGAEASLIRCIDGTDEFVEVPGPRVCRASVESQAIGRQVAGSRDCQRLAEAGLVPKTFRSAVDWPPRTWNDVRALCARLDPPLKVTAGAERFEN